MTFSEVSALLPPPEGMEWRQRPRAPKDYMLVVVSTGVQAGYLFTDAPLSDANDHPCVVSMTVADRHYREIVAHPDLPSAYLRALAAVGLAPDAEKERLRESLASLNVAHDVAVKHIGKLAGENAALRRRLTWSEDVPTGDGLVLVWHPGDDEPEMWRTLGTADGIQWEHHNYVGHGNPFPPGTRFLPLVNLKEP